MLRLPKINDFVNCPPDRGQPSYTGHVTSVGQTVNTNIHGVKYVWCDVYGPMGHRAVWPSNRLGYTIP